MPVFRAPRRPTIPHSDDGVWNVLDDAQVPWAFVNLTPEAGKGGLPSVGRGIALGGSGLIEQS
jgi:hypothetical protein